MLHIIIDKYTYMCIYIYIYMYTYFERNSPLTFMYIHHSCQAARRVAEVRLALRPLEELGEEWGDASPSLEASGSWEPWLREVQGWSILTNKDGDYHLVNKHRPWK